MAFCAVFRYDCRLTAYKNEEARGATRTCTFNSRRMPFPYPLDCGATKGFIHGITKCASSSARKVFKVMLDAGFTCPNRDGSIATGGCTFCSARGSGDFAGSRRDDLVTQFNKIRDLSASEMAGSPLYRLFSGIYEHVCAGRGAAGIL